MEENKLIKSVINESQKYSKLQKYDFLEFSGKKYQAINTKFTQNFENQRFRNAHFLNCEFSGCNFNSTGLAEAHFNNCLLKDCNISNSNLQYCDFSMKSKLCGSKDDSVIYSCNLSHSMFSDMTLQNIHFNSVTISQACFINSKLHSVNFEASTLQDNLFRDIEMDGVSLAGCNIEYSEFRNVTMKNVILPFHQIVYAYGLLDCLSLENESISVASVSSGMKVSAKEYLNLLPELLNYYNEMNEYFPEINILLFLKKYDLANEKINAAIKDYIRFNDFRKIKGICKLIADHDYFDKHYMAQLYFKLVEYYNRIHMSEYEQYQYSLNINEIKNILTGVQKNIPSAHLVLKTNISADQITQLGELHYIVEQCMTENGLSTDDYTIEIRHNSDPLSIWLIISNINVHALIGAVGMLLSALTGNFQYIESSLSVLANVCTIGAFLMQILDKKNAKNESIIHNTCPTDVADSVRKKNDKIKKLSIDIQVSSVHFNFKYESQKTSEG